jgi:hypothetical protein
MKRAAAGLRPAVKKTVIQVRDSAQVRNTHPNEVICASLGEGAKDLLLLFADSLRSANLLLLTCPLSLFPYPLVHYFRPLSFRTVFPLK